MASTLIDTLKLEQVQRRIVWASDSVISINAVMSVLELDGYHRVTFVSKDKDKYSDMYMDLREPEVRAIAERFAKEIKEYWLEELEASNKQLQEAINDERAIQ